MSTTQDLRWGGIVTDRPRSTSPATRVRARMWTSSGQARYAELTEENLLGVLEDVGIALLRLHDDRRPVGGES